MLSNQGPRPKAAWANTIRKKGKENEMIYLIWGCKIIQIAFEMVDKGVIGSIIWLLNLKTINITDWVVLSLEYNKSQKLFIPVL